MTVFNIEEQPKKRAIGLIHRIYLNKLKNGRKYTASTKTKSEVRGGGKKPWRQKGTGKARAGSTRSPLWVGGGVSFGPKPRVVRKKTNRKELRLAILTAFYLKQKSFIFLSDNNILEELIPKNLFNNNINNEESINNIIENINDNMRNNSNIQIPDDIDYESIKNISEDIAKLDQKIKLDKAKKLKSKKLKDKKNKIEIKDSSIEKDSSLKKEIKDIDFKTKNFKKLINDLKIEENSKVLFIIPDRYLSLNTQFWHGSRNLKNIEILTSKTLNILSIIKSDHIILSHLTQEDIIENYGKPYRRIWKKS